MWTRAGPVVILAVLIVCDVAIVAGQNISFSYPFGFNDEKNGNISISGDVIPSEYSYSMNTGALDPGESSCGRIIYKDKVQMVDNATRTVASFKTSFTFSYKSDDNTTCGDGMVFAFYANSSVGAQPYSRAGGPFCVLNVTGPYERLFAVEFDSFYNEGADYNDFSDSHISVDFGNKNLSFRKDRCDVNTTLNRCANQYNLCSQSQYFYPGGGPADRSCGFFCKDKTAVYTAWIDYNSTGQMLEVRFRVGSFPDGSGKPGTANFTIPNLNLGDFLDDWMYVGFTGSTGWKREIHTLSSWEFETSGMPIPLLVQSPAPAPAPAPVISPQNTKPKSKSTALIVGVSVAAVAAFVAGLLIFCFIQHRKRPNSFKNLELISSWEASETSRAFTYRELSRSTKNFNASELLSSGAFGDVFKGILPSGALIAVKRIKENKEHGEESFLAEATSLRQIRHRNLLQLRGWSHTREGLFLVYDYMCNASLDKWTYQNSNPNLNEDENKAALSWGVRRFILAGVASGLEYLHEGWVQCVLHRDIKSSNVMLDADFNAYLGDFGLARLIDHNKLQRTTLLAGTLGYMAPEMIHTGRATKETDIYAFGILMLEVVCGKRPLDPQATDAANFVLLDSVWRAHEAGNIFTVADTSLSEGKLPGGLLEDAAMAEVPLAGDVSMTADRFEDKMMVANILRLGLLCCLPNPSERPPMRVVNRWFQSSEAGVMDQLPPLPATKPHYAQYSVSHSSEGTGTSSSSKSSGFNHLSLPRSTSSSTGSFATRSSAR